MNKQRIVLIPIDFCNAAETAVKYAIDHKYDGSTRIILLHTYRLITEDASHFSDSPFAFKTSIEKEIREKYKTLHAKLNLDNYPQVEFLLEIGFLVNFINSMCKESNIDLIVYGLKKSGSNKSLIEIVSSGYSPVLIIKGDYLKTTKYKETILSQDEFINHSESYISTSSSDSLFLIKP
jgi:nucleotide-binding universal stress UspA family protein